MSEWKECKLGEIYDFASGLSKSRDQFGFGYSFLSFRDVFHNYFVPKEITQLANSTEKERERCSIKRGDVFLTRTSETQEELGMSSVALKDYLDATFNGFTKRLRPKNNMEILPEYAGFYFRSPRFRATLTSMASITTRASLNNGMLSELTVVIPPLPEQRAIASVLSSLDGKIDLLHRQNKTLEAMAETLFRQWFVQPIIQAERDGSKAVGFQSGKLDKWIETTLGGDWGKENPTGDFVVPVYCIRGTDIADLNTGIPRKTPVRHVKKKKFENIEPKEGDIIIEISGGAENQSTGRTTYINGDIKSLFQLPLVFSNFCRLLKIKKEEYSFFVYSYLQYLYKQDEFFNLENGSSGIKNLDYNALLFELDYPLPQESMVVEFDEEVKDYFKKINQNKSQIRTLEKLRDTLLPKLMSCEVRVSY